MSSRSCHRCGVLIREKANFCVGCGEELRHDEGKFRFSSPDPLIGQIVADRYHILELVGRGGMGVVYKVEHIRMGKLMAMKLLHGEIARDTEIIKRFKREARAVSRLSHPNTVQIFDFGRSDGLMYLIMEYIEGNELARLLRDAGAIPFRRCAVLVAQICSSLGEAHDNGIIHRDLKPENIMIRTTRDAKDMVKVLDFGLAKLRETEERGDKTSQGILVGTPHYMSPEQIQGEDIDHRSDIYSLGATMYKMLSGEPPFPAQTPVAILTKHLNESPEQIGKKYPQIEICEEMERLVEKCLVKDPKKRYQNVDEIRDELFYILDAYGGMDSIPSDSSIPRRSGNQKIVAKNGEDLEEKGKPVETPFGAMRVGERILEIGNRNEFERFERLLRFRRRISWFAAFFPILGASLFALWFILLRVQVEPVLELHYQFFPPTVHVEQEPNNEPYQAERIWPSIPVKGTVGKRISHSESDRDWYRFLRKESKNRILRVVLTPIPRMNLVLQAYTFDSEGSRLIAESNSGGPGQGEVLSLSIEHYPEVYVLVREEWLLGRAPTENISDFYGVEVELLSGG